MNIYLMQHGKQVSKEEDPDKPLSNQGKEDVERVASFLLRAGISVEDIFHSGKTRARETAEIMISKLIPGKESVKKNGLAPLDDVKEIAGEIENGQKDLVLVGHLPHLAKLTSLLITGRDSNTVVKFQQGGIVCLRHDDDEEVWAIAWMLVPEIIK
ncbi:MAG: phosphohistidine phosphatase SixA [Deltaproteobacteria bacterium]|nr:phosphohistidine phosphatase SixA [Deltaproteobacteria bacterium]